MKAVIAVFFLGCAAVVTAAVLNMHQERPPQPPAEKSNVAPSTPSQSDDVGSITATADKLIGSNLGEWLTASDSDRESAAGVILGRVFDKTNMHTGELVDCLNDASKETSALTQRVSEIATACILTHGGSR